MTQIKGMVQSFTDEDMLVQGDNSRWFRFPIPAERPAVGEWVAVYLAEGDKAELVRLHTPPKTQEDIAKTMYRYDRIEEERVPTAAHIDDEQIRRFWERGYLVVDQLMNGEEVREAITAIDDIIQGRIVGPRLQFKKKDEELRTPEERELAMRKLHKFVDYAPALRHACFHPDSQSILTRIFGEPPKFLEDQAILKPPSTEAGMEKPWHQDMAYGNLSQTKMVCGVWIALDEAGLDNGCMHVIPGTHRDGPIPHYAIRDWQICDAHVKVEHDVAVPLRPGGALFFAGLLHHGTPPNFSKRRRRALQFHYCPASSEKMSPQQFKEMFTTDMPDAEC